MSDFDDEIQRQKAEQQYSEQDSAIRDNDGTDDDNEDICPNCGSFMFHDDPDHDEVLHCRNCGEEIDLYYDPMEDM
jgi:hypothetical protein